MNSIMKTRYLTGLLVACIAVALIASCKKDSKLPDQTPIDYTAIKTGVPNALDKLTDTLFKTYGVRVFYEFNPRITRFR
jgi:Flp pilus assembly pilin Flp